MSDRPGRRSASSDPSRAGVWLAVATVLGLIPALYLGRGQVALSLHGVEPWGYVLGSAIGILVRSMICGGVAWLLVWALFVRRRLPGSLDKGFIAVAAVFAICLIQWALPAFLAR